MSDYRIDLKAKNLVLYLFLKWRISFIHPHVILSDRTIFCLLKQAQSS